MSDQPLQELKDRARVLKWASVSNEPGNWLLHLAINRIWGRQLRTTGQVEYANGETEPFGDGLSQMFYQHRIFLAGSAGIPVEFEDNPTIYSGGVVGPLMLPVCVYKIGKTQIVSQSTGPNFTTYQTRLVPVTFEVYAPNAALAAVLAMEVHAVYGNVEWPIGPMQHINTQQMGESDDILRNDESEDASFKFMIMYGILCEACYNRFPGKLGSGGFTHEPVNPDA